MPAADSRRGLGRLRLHNWRVPVRLFALIAIPTFVAALLAGYRVSVSWGDASDYQRLERLAKLGEQMAAFSHELEGERDLRVDRTANPTYSLVTLDTLRAKEASVDEAAGKVRAAARDASTEGSPGLELTVRTVLTRIEVLPALRKLADELPPGAIVDKYSGVITDVNDFHIQLAQGAPKPDLAQNALALSAIARAKDAASQERALVAIGLWAGRFEPADLRSLESTSAEWESLVATFRSTATGDQRRLYEDTVTGTEIDRTESMRLQAVTLARGSNQLRVRPLGVTAARQWGRDMTEKTGRMRTVEKALAESLTKRTKALGEDAFAAAIRDAVILFLVIAIVLIATIIVARSLVRPLRRLRNGALEVAGTRLPGLVDRLRDPEAAAGGIEVDPIDIISTDEIGQVARAFDEVHREAVRLAADEAVLRGNINAMFVNLSRRSQSLIERQLRLIEELEQSERDEEQLANLFRLDHLATRMRRNCENLLVLGGQDQARKWNRPVPLIDVVRASLSEVEQYERVALRVQGEMTVAGPMVNDLVHLLAELVENATVFSAESTKVTVSGQLLSGGGAMLQITDNGVGMSVEELEQANWRLANPPVIDFSAARRMGLFVVGRLAVRHGIRVELRAAQGGGLTAFVVLPDAGVSPSESGGVGSRNFSGNREFDAPAPVLSAGAGAPMALSAPASGASGSFQQPGTDGRGGPPVTFRDTGAQPSFQDTGARPSLQDTGPRQSYQDTGPRPSYQDTGSQPSYQDSGPQPSYQDSGPRPSYQDSGPQPSYQDSGPQPSYQDSGPQQRIRNTGGQPRVSNTGPLPRIQGTGPQQIVSPMESSRPPHSSSGQLPVRQPGAQLPGRADPASQTGPLPAVGDGRHQTGPLPAVPEAQPRIPEQQNAPEPNQRRQISWETGPQPAVQAFGSAGDYDRGAEPGHQPGPEQGTGRGASWGEPYGAGQGGAGQGSAGQGGAGQGGTRQGGPGQGGPRQPAPFTLEEPVLEPPAPEPAVRSEPPPSSPERSPIFDAMQSEWFQRRTEVGGGKDPVKGWESPADAGFQAAEAVREPVAGKLTSVGLPKRVPGKNRVPGAVASPGTQTTGTGPVEQPPAPRQSQSADVVRNRFASLQRGVHRGRTQAQYGGQGESTGENPSQQGGGETGGTR
ncbi:nitrate- and nitrite sensing domain-containing protein [Actinomadura rudentiformis]|uniref:nitrate- and nitrite sensing domain-containing protein n=1 Tax=Actinomadura rudentiformis TaxID=359158 RepID=UPI00178C27C3|nr:nitrate- and nitrite sensing domain-containing protein [Actinomadura rudentiformis]